MGRPKKEIDGQEKKLIRQDELVRNAIEGKLGQGKRRFSLDCIRAKLPVTSGSMIALTFLVMNLEKFLREFFYDFLRCGHLRPLLIYDCVFHLLGADKTFSASLN
ncbi:MAG: transposase [Spirochaetaceae bacterium]|nr:MAG: transposase [Spirochaetaceae bacterium]